MSDTYFSKLDAHEKESRLIQLAESKGQVTVWVKGKKILHKFKVMEYDKNRFELILDSRENLYPLGTSLLCTFELRGMNFFLKVLVNKSILGNFLLETPSELFKSEKRSSYRLLTFPIYNVSAEFDLAEAYEGGKVVDIKSRTSQTALFKNFLKLVEMHEDEKKNQNIKYRIQDLSVTGMSLQIGELESQFFKKDFIFKDVQLHFPDELIKIPQVKVVYIVDYISRDKKIKTYKVGLHFLNLTTTVDEMLGRKINELLRQIDFNKDFENFTK